MIGAAVEAPGKQQGGNSAVFIAYHFPVQDAAHRPLSDRVWYDLYALTRLPDASLLSSPADSTLSAPRSVLHPSITSLIRYFTRSKLSARHPSLALFEVVVCAQQILNEPFQEFSGEGCKRAEQRTRLPSSIRVSMCGTDIGGAPTEA